MLKIYRYMCQYTHEISNPVESTQASVSDIGVILMLGTPLSITLVMYYCSLDHIHTWSLDPISIVSIFICFFKVYKDSGNSRIE